MRPIWPPISPVALAVWAASSLTSAATTAAVAAAVEEQEAATQEILRAMERATAGTGSLTATIGSGSSLPDPVSGGPDAAEEALDLGAEMLGLMRQRIGPKSALRSLRSDFG
jgi:hypothetical protein